MINKENSDKEQNASTPEESGLIDIAYMDVQCHIMIKDKDTGEILVNQRG
jgi:hypothetical protein